MYSTALCLPACQTYPLDTELLPAGAIGCHQKVNQPIKSYISPNWHMVGGKWLVKLLGRIMEGYK